MLQTPPAIPGMREDEIDTPALLIDLDAFEYNLDHMAAMLAPTGVKLRAHAKTHKSPVIGKLQMARGDDHAHGACAEHSLDTVLSREDVALSYALRRLHLCRYHYRRTSLGCQKGAGKPAHPQHRLTHERRQD